MKTKKLFRNKRLASLFKQNISTERPCRELCSTVLNKKYCFPGHPLCSIFRGGPRNVMLAERGKIILGNLDRTSSLVHSIFRHFLILKTNSA